MTIDRRGFGHPSLPSVTSLRLYGKRVMLRALVPTDFDAYHEVRTRNGPWLTVWEPARLPGPTDPSMHREAFNARCNQRERDRQQGLAYGFGVFVDNAFAGEVNINGITRGASQVGTIGYWIDRKHAGQRYIPEGVVVALRFAFEELHLHRIEVCIVPRNLNSRRVADVLALRDEGVAQRFLEINGVWEDHVRYAITVEEWAVRAGELGAAWLA